MSTSRDAEVRRILDRYLIEVVERFDLCPWARSARVNGEVAIEIAWASPSDDEVIAASRAALARPGTKIAMIVFPERSPDLPPLRELRDRVSAALPGIGIAHFSPAGALDLATPARLVPFVRRSPDPLLQLVPLALLDSIRATPVATERAHQAAILAGLVAPPRGDVGDLIAAANHARISAELAAVTAALDDIAADRAATYARLGISTCP